MDFFENVEKISKEKWKKKIVEKGGFLSHAYLRHYLKFREFLVNFSAGATFTPAYAHVLSTRIQERLKVNSYICGTEMVFLP